MKKRKAPDKVGWRVGWGEIIFCKIFHCSTPWWVPRNATSVGY